MNPRESWLKILAAMLIAGLSLQYALGMYVNLFVSFPENATENQLWEFTATQWPLVVHIFLALAIAIGAAALCVLSVFKQDKAWIWPSGIGLVAILVAAVSGSQFVSTQTDVYSYMMSLFFLIAALSYGWSLYRSRYYTTPRP